MNDDRQDRQGLAEDRTDLAEDRTAMAACDSDPSRTVMIGDTAHDIEMAIAASV